MDAWYYTRIAVRRLCSKLIVLQIFQFSTFTSVVAHQIFLSHFHSHSFAGFDNFLISAHPIAPVRAIVERWGSDRHSRPHPCSVLKREYPCLLGFRFLPRTACLGHGQVAQPSLCKATHWNTPMLVARSVAEVPTFAQPISLRFASLRYTAPLPANLITRTQNFRAARADVSSFLPRSTSVQSR